MKIYHKSDISSTTPVGFTRISDEIIDRWMPRLSGARFKIVMYIARRTYGFNKEQDSVSYDQIVNGIKRADGTVLDEGTGLSRSTVIAECAWLASKKNGGVLQKASEQVNGQHKTNRWALNLAVIIGKDGKGSAKSAGSGGGLISGLPSSDYRPHNKQLDNKQIPPLHKVNLVQSPQGDDAETPKKEKPCDLFEDVEDMLDDLNAEERGLPETSLRRAQPTPQEKQAGQDAVKDRSPRRRDLMAIYREERKKLQEEKAQMVELPHTEADVRPLDGPVQPADRASWPHPHQVDQQTVEMILDIMDPEGLIESF